MQHIVFSRSSIGAYLYLRYIAALKELSDIKLGDFKREALKLQHRFLNVALVFLHLFYCSFQHFLVTLYNLRVELWARVLQLIPRAEIWIGFLFEKDTVSDIWSPVDRSFLKGPAPQMTINHSLGWTDLTEPIAHVVSVLLQSLFRILWSQELHKTQPFRTSWRTRGINNPNNMSYFRTMQGPFVK